MKTKLEIKCERNKYSENYYVIELESRTYFSDVDFAKIQGAIATIKGILDPLIDTEVAENEERKKKAEAKTAPTSSK